MKKVIKVWFDSQNRRRETVEYVKEEVYEITLDDASLKPQEELCD